MHDLLEHVEIHHYNDNDRHSISSSSCSTSDEDAMDTDSTDLQFELDSMNTFDTLNHFDLQQSLYNDAQNNTCFSSSSSISTPFSPTTHHHALKSTKVYPPTTTIPNRFDLPTVIPERREEDAQTQIESSTDDEKKEKPFKCNFKGCDKGYKNPGGLKYHLQNGHVGSSDEVDLSIQRPFQCNIEKCVKRYKNSNGLKVCIYYVHYD